MNITVTTPDGERFSVRCDMPMDLTIGYLKDQIHAAEPRYTPFHQQIFSVTDVGREYREWESMIESAYRLVLPADRADVEFTDHTGMYHSYDYHRCTRNVDENCPLREDWDTWKRLLVEQGRDAEPRVLCYKVELEAGLGRTVTMACCLVREEEGTWKKQIHLLEKA